MDRFESCIILTINLLKVKSIWGIGEIGIRSGLKIQSDYSGTGPSPVSPTTSDLIERRLS